MNGIDALLAESIMMEFKTSCPEILPDLKKHLKKTYDISMLDSIKDFKKFDSVLNDVVGTRKADKIKKDLISSLFRIEKIKNELWLTTVDPFFVVKSLDSYGDPYKRIILEIIRSDNKVIHEILKNSGVPQASTYRRINELLKDGFIVGYGVVSGKEGRFAKKYGGIIEKINILISDALFPNLN